MNTGSSIRKHASFKGIIGIAREDITPPAGIYSRNWGAALKDVADGIHMPLTLTCVTFRSDVKEKPLVLIAVDLGWWKDSEDERIFRNKLLESSGLDAPQLMFCLSHTHAGPGLCRDDRFSSGGEFIEPYLDLLLESAVRAIKRAASVEEPAILTWHYGKCALATNRDLAGPARGQYVVGFNPEKPADDTLLVGRLTDRQNKIFGTIVNYACHPTTLAWNNRLISPDYVGSMREVIEMATEAPCLFLQGASGDLAPAEQYVSDVHVAESHGRQLGFAVLTTLEDMLAPQTQLCFSEVVQSGATLALWSRSAYESSNRISFKMIKTALPLKPMKSLNEIESEWHQCEDRVLKERLWRRYHVRKAVGDGDTAAINAWIWQLGDSFLVGHPNEAYSDFQLALRRPPAARAVVVMNVVNGSVGYLPPESLYNKNLYSVLQTPFESGSLEKLTSTVLEAINKMNPEE